MNEQAFREFLATRKYSDEQLAAAVQTAGEFESWLVQRGHVFPTAPIDDLKQYLAGLVRDGRNTRERLLDLARYCWHAKRNDFYIYFTAMFGGLGVYDSIAARLEGIAGKAVREEVFQGVAMPPLGSPPEAYPPITRLLMERLGQHLSPAQVRTVLAGNHHGIPVEGFEKHKAWFKELQSIDGFLKKVHQEAVAELEEYLRTGRIWYEQEITPEVVEYVRSNQELLSAVRHGDRLYLTKIPYAGQEYLRETDPVMKRYYACHCPLARQAILMDDTNVQPDWCYCSGGFEKLMFDVVFEEPMDVEVLESALKGDPRCRFAIKISPGAR
jgi:hypothetical protein